MKSVISGIIIALLLIGILTLTFSIQPARAQSGTIYINSDGSITPSDANITTSDNVTYTFTGNNYLPIIVERSNIIINGMGYTLQASGETAFLLTGMKNVTIKSTRITRSWYGIDLYYCSGNVLSDNDVTANGGVGIYLCSSSSNVVSDNNVTENGVRGIYLCSSSSNVLSGNNLTADGGDGLMLILSSDNNTLSANSIKNNLYGVCLHSCSGNRFFHNDFVNNTQQTIVGNSTNTWDDGYPSGGNYWSDYQTRYPDASEIDSSGIWNTPYVIDANNTDYYPLMKPWTPTPSVVTATVAIYPRALNLCSRGRWITAYIELPEGYDVRDINVSSILLNNTIPVAPSAPTRIRDYNNNGVPDLMVEFNRTAVSEFILSKGIKHGKVTLTLTGKLVNGTTFIGSHVIKVSARRRALYETLSSCQTSRTYCHTLQRLKLLLIRERGLFGLSWG